MSKIKKFWEIAKADGAIGGWITLLTSVFLLVTSLFLPPKGQIDPSVLQGVAELGFFATLFKLPQIIASIQDGKSLTLQHNDTTITVASREGEDEDKKEEA